MMSKKGVSPLVATILLIVFSLILGTVTLNLGKAYIEEMVEPEQEKQITKTIDNEVYECVEFNEQENKCISWEITT